MAPDMLDAAEAAAPPVDGRLGRPLEDIPFLDDATRPKAPPIPGVTPAQRARGRRLALYHRHHLAELAAVRVALDHFLAGTGTVEAVTDGVASLTLEHRAGYRIQHDALGYCAASAFSESRFPPFGPML